MVSALPAFHLDLPPKAMRVLTACHAGLLSVVASVVGIFSATRCRKSALSRLALALSMFLVQRMKESMWAITVQLLALPRAT